MRLKQALRSLVVMSVVGQFLLQSPDVDEAADFVGSDV